MARSASALVQDAPRPHLFGQLGPDIFMVFSGGNRVFYERAILAIYNELYRSDLLFPTQAEVVAVIYGRLSQEPGLWTEDESAVDLDRLVTRTGRRVRRRRVEGTHDEATGTAISRSRHIYNRLLQTGWLDESSYGLKTTVEMPSGAMQLAEFLHSLKEGVTEQLGGLVIEVRNAIRAVREKPAENALGLNKAARDAASFGRYLRSVLSALRDVDRQVLSSDTLADRLRHYFEDFVERVLLRDYTAIATTAHPYRYRRAILTSLDDLEESEINLAAIADAYLEARLVSDALAARDLVQEDIFPIRRVFNRIEEAFDAIQQHRSRLETRLRNVVRYAGRRTSFLQRSERVIQALDEIIASKAEYPAIRGSVEPRIPLIASSLLARPRGSRTGISDIDLAIPPADPVREFRRKLERAYLDRLTITPAKVSRFLERQVPPFGEKPAIMLSIETIDDFLAFEALRVMVAAGLGVGGQTRLARELRGRFELVSGNADVVSNDWLECPGFLVRRLDDSVTLGPALLLEFTSLEERNPRGFQRVTQLIAHLMRNQFVHAEDRGAAILLETLHRPELAKLVEAYFDVAGYLLIHRATEGWAGILPDPERISPPRMRIEETVALLVMRRLWEESLQLGEMSANGTVRTTLNEAYAAYQGIVAGTRRAGLSPNDFRDVLQTLEKRAIVRLGELDAEAQDMDLDIRALVTMVSGDDFVASLEQILSRPVITPAKDDGTAGPEDVA